MLTATFTPGSARYGQIAILKNGAAYKLVSVFNPDAGANTYKIGEGSFQIEGTSSDVFKLQAVYQVSSSTYSGGDAVVQNYFDLEMI
jgi:hypothetical protein